MASDAHVRFMTFYGVFTLQMSTNYAVILTGVDRGALTVTQEATWLQQEILNLPYLAFKASYPLIHIDKWTNMCFVNIYYHDITVDLFRFSSVSLALLLFPHSFVFCSQYHHCRIQIGFTFAHLSHKLH